MDTLVKTKVGQGDELVRGLPGEIDEVLARSRDALGADAPVPPTEQEFSTPPLSLSELVEEAHTIAKRLHGCAELSERIEIYKEVGQRFKSEWRRVLNTAAVRWPGLMPRVNDEVEWKALLSADLS